jgi:hypothetical protein
MIDAAAGKLANATTAAADTLQGLLVAQSEAVRLSAAKALLELSIKVRDAADHEQRLRALERLADWIQGEADNEKRNDSAAA